MGSLVAGWSADAPGLPPPELRDDVEEQEDQGYFAKYERQKSMRRACGDRECIQDLETLPLNPAHELDSMPSRRLTSHASLTRASAPVGGLPALQRSLSLGVPQGVSVPSPFANAGAGAGLSRSLDRTSSMRSDRSYGPSPASPIGRSASLMSPSSPTARRTASSLDAYKIGSPSQKKFEVQWWQRVDSGCLNEDTVLRAECPEEDEACAARGAAYSPQYHLTGQANNYRTSPARGLEAVHVVKASA